MATVAQKRERTTALRELDAVRDGAPRLPGNRPYIVTPQRFRNAAIREAFASQLRQARKGVGRTSKPGAKRWNGTVSRKQERQRFEQELRQLAGKSMSASTVD